MYTIVGNGGDGGGGGGGDDGESAPTTTGLRDQQQLQIHTFHSFCQHLLVQHAKKVGLSDDWLIADKWDQGYFLEVSEFVGQRLQWLQWMQWLQWLQWLQLLYFEIHINIPALFVTFFRMLEANLGLTRKNSSL